MNVKGLSHVTIQAKDYKGTMSFYTEVLEFKVGHSWSLPEYNIKEAFMLISPDQRTCIELFDDAAVIPAQGKKASSEDDIAHGALLHFSFYVDDVETIYRKGPAHGAKPYVEPGRLSLGEPQLIVKNALIHSPNGEVIEFIEDIDFDLTK